MLINKINLLLFLTLTPLNYVSKQPEKYVLVGLNTEVQAFL